MFLRHTYQRRQRPPYGGLPAIEVERFEDGEDGVAKFLDFLASIFDVEQVPVIDVPGQPRPVATLIMLEKVHLQMTGYSLYIVCKKEKTRDRILARLQEHRLEWSRVLGPLRFAQREKFWMDRHGETLAWAVALNGVAIGFTAMLWNGIYLEDGYEDTLLWIAFFILMAAPKSFQSIRSIWTFTRCNSGAIQLPREILLTERKIVGVLREETFTGPGVVDIDLEEIEKLWFWTERPLERGGRVRKKIRWKYRLEPFGVLSHDQYIIGVVVRAAGRKTTIWADRFDGDDAVRALCTAVQQSVRERLFPEDAS